MKMTMFTCLAMGILAVCGAEAKTDWSKYKWAIRCPIRGLILKRH